MRWSVSLQAEGDRVIEIEEIVELADAVAGNEGIASGMGTRSYGAQIVVEADSSDEAVARATGIFSAAAAEAGLPDWPIVNIETVADEEEMGWYEDIPDVHLRGGQQ